MLRVALIGSPQKSTAADLLDRTRRWLAQRVEIVFSEITFDASRALASKPDVLFVLGGDGTLIAVVQSLRQNQIPIVGINLGKLGFLAEFNIDQLEQDGEFLFSGVLPVTRRILLHVRIQNGESGSFEALAVNDCVVLNGPPYRMIELRMEADGDSVAELRGDGMIIATPSGSTAHNLSAGGPILEPTAESLILTPVCPHALTFRPLVMNSSRRLTLQVTRANEGTTAVIDGQITRPLRATDRLTITRYPADFLLVRNPVRSPWYSLRRKLMWGEAPKNVS
ncbi:MAG: NAD(+)/NADH kinase [Phycisphaerae bacterium]